MQLQSPPNAANVRKIVEERLKAVEEITGVQETVTVEWRGAQRTVPVISMPVQLLSYNPVTHRIRAQRTLDPDRDRDLEANPFGPDGQAYLHQLLAGDPTDPTKADPTFDALKEDLRLNGQNEPGIITRDGILINGNTRRAALQELGQEHMRVGVLPPDAGLDDLQSIELALQLRKEFKRDYSFMNFLLAIQERTQMGKAPSDIQRDFRIKAKTYERALWILELVEEAIRRSEVVIGDDKHAMRLVDFETHQGKLEELHRAYMTLKSKSPEDADALREQRLIAIVLGKSKTDVRYIDAEFSEKYLKELTARAAPQAAAPVKIPGTSIDAKSAGPRVRALRAAADDILKARALDAAAASTPGPVAAAAAEKLARISADLDVALTRAGKTGRLQQRRFAAADRLSDANEDLSLAVDAVAEARATNNFNPEDLEEQILDLKRNLLRLTQLMARGTEGSAAVEAEGATWLRSVAGLDTGP